MIKVITIEFSSPEEQMNIHFLSFDDNPYLHDFKNLVAKAVAQSLNEEEIKRDYLYTKKSKFMKDSLFYFPYYINWDKVAEIMSRYGFKLLNSDISYEAGTWTSLMVDGSLDSFDDELTEIEKVIQSELKKLDIFKQLKKL
ncbi:hypothetical protein GWK41_06165 [Persephonella atlantica]|uniref:Uncharacterized protein n=1 Tax=Persephonella atlantica TaxID=2699429 RepID=A0ABS1GIB7_9AQUI|nr:hypothetical protein [Persephonella atlantica]MBK3332647.1 hypothetical protein [Persephonella atlantica]